MDGEQSVSALARNYDMSITAVQRHVGVLERAGLITRRRVGRETLARTDAAELRSASQLITELEQHWRDRVDRMDTPLASDPPPRPASPRPDPTQED